MATGDVVGARRRFADAADAHGRMLDQEGSAYCLDGLAAVALAQGQPEVAARLLGASSHARALVGVAIWPGMKPLADALRAAVIAALGDADFQTATAEGTRMRLNEALDYALESTGTTQSASEEPASADRT